MLPDDVTVCWSCALNVAIDVGCALALLAFSGLRVYQGVESGLLLLPAAVVAYAVCKGCFYWFAAGGCDCEENPQE